MGIDPVSIGIQLAVMAAQMALTAARRIEGPRLDDTKLNAGDYGATLTRVWGDRWVTPPVFWGEDLKHIEVESKTKGGKNNQHKYFGTWAVLLAPHEIAAVLQIKLDGHLVYDVTGTGPVTPFDFGTSGGGGGKGTGGALGLIPTLIIGSGGGAGAGGSSINEHMAIYYGTADQEPDERMLATVEAQHGVGSCPAYRGKAYLVIKDLPLEKFGNRIPQFTARITTAAAGTIPTEQRDYTLAPNSAFNLVFSSDYARMAWMVGGVGTEPGGFEVWDVRARAMMISSPLPVGYTVDAASHFGLYNNGDLLAYKYDGATLNRITPDGVITLVQHDATVNHQQFGCRVIADGVGHEHWGTYPYSFYERWFFDGVLYEPGYQACLYFADSYGNVWVVGRQVAAGSTTDQVYFKRLVTVDNTPHYLTEFAVTMPDAAGPGGQGEGVYACAAGDNFVCDWENKLHLIDPVTGTLLSSHAATAGGVVYSQKTVWNNIVPGSGRVWRGNSEYDLLTGELVRTVTGVPASGGGFRSVYDPLNHALIVAKDDLTWYYVDRAAGATVTWGTVVANACALAGIDPATIDVTQLTQPFSGYSAAGGSGKDWLEPGNDLFDVDPRPHGFQLEFVNRGAVPSVTLSSDDFALADGEQPLYQWTGKQGSSDVPAEVSVAFADTAIDQKPNATQSGPFAIGDGVRKLTLSMSTLAIGAAYAQQLGGRYHRRLAFDSGGLSLSVPSRQIALEPGDVRVLSLRGDLVKTRLASIEMQADRRFATEWKRDDPSVAVLSAAVGAAADGQAASTIIVPGIARGFVLDIPLLRDADADSRPVLYVAAGPYSEGTSFPGAAIYEAVGGEYSENFASVSSANRATWGYATGVLAYADPGVWDRGNTVNVILQNGSLTGCTEADVNADPQRNLMLLGDELVNFTTATLELDGSYTVSGLLRGRRGTEWACGTHAARDVVLLTANASPHPEGLSDVGTDMSFKAVTEGNAISGAFEIDVAPFSGASLKPYAPAIPRAGQAGATGEWTLTWVRRTRVGGAWTGGAAIPLSEASELYDVEILNDAGAVVRTYAGLTTPTVAYPAADQATDFGIAVGSFAWRVYQISDAVGRGFAAVGAAASGLDAIGAPFSTQWRLRFPVGAVSPSEYASVWEAELRGRYGSADQCSGGTPSASSERDGLRAVANAFDNDPSTGSFPWQPNATGVTSSWLQYTFAAAVHVAQFAVTSTGGFGPKQIILEYWDGATWQQTFDSGTLTTWATPETKIFDA